MLVRCFRAHTMPLERVGSTAEHKVLEALAELHCSSSSGGCGGGSGLSVGLLTHSPQPAAASSTSSSTSSGGMWSMGQSFDPWRAAMDSSSSSSLSVESSSTSSSSLSVSSSSSSDASAAELFTEADLECVLQSSSSTSSLQDLMTSSSAGSRIAAGSRYCAGHTADTGRRAVLLCTSQQPLPQQQQPQQPVPPLPLLRHSAQPAAAATAAASGPHAPSKHQSALPWWGWSWAFCKSSISSTDSSCGTTSSSTSDITNTSRNGSSSSSSSSAGGCSGPSSKHNRAPAEGSYPCSHGSTAQQPQQLAQVISVSSSSSSSSSSSLWYEAGVAAAADVGCLHPAVQAYLQGNLGIAFSGGGFRYTYFVGVMDVLLHKLGLIDPQALLSGASSGSLIAVFTKCGLPVEKVLQLTMEFSQDCASKGVRGRLGVVLRSYLDAYLPDNAHELCDGSTFLAVTRVLPTIRTRLFSSFPSRADLINAVLASCHLPTLSDGSLTMKFKGQLHIDGGLLSVVTPPPHAAHTVLVCSMPSRQIAKLPALITRPHQSLISISPDTYQPWPFTRKQTTALALEPPNPDFIHHMVERGRSDALAWAEAVGFTRNGQPLFPTAQHLEAVRQQLFDPTDWLTPVAAGVPTVQLSPAAAAAAAASAAAAATAAVGEQQCYEDPLLLLSQKASVSGLYQN